MGRKNNSMRYQFRLYKGKELARDEALGLVKEYTEYADENLEGEE